MAVNCYVLDGEVHTGVELATRHCKFRCAQESKKPTQHAAQIIALSGSAGSAKRTLRTARSMSLPETSRLG